MGRLYAISQRLKSAGKASCGLAFFIFFFFLPWSAQSQDSASLRGTVRDAQGNPLAGATVQLHFNEAQIQTVLTDSQGRYSFATLRSGVCVLRAEHDGYSGAEIPSLFLGPQEKKTVDVALQPVRSPALSPAQKPAFFDQPQFTVSGVTDTTNLGGHGSDTIVRARETLAKETVSLGKDSVVTATVGKYERQRESIQASLVREDTAVLHHSLAEVQEIQRRLTALGFDTGGTDGRVGNDTMLAVQNFQRKIGMQPADGYAGVNLLARLREAR